MTDKEPQGEGLLLHYRDENFVCSIDDCAKKKRNGRCQLAFIEFGKNEIGEVNYKDCRSFVPFAKLKGYIKLPAPGTEAYQKLREKIIARLQQYVREVVSQWFKTDMKLEETADSVLALLGEEK